MITEMDEWGRRSEQKSEEGLNRPLLRVDVGVVGGVKARKIKGERSGFGS